MVQRYAVFPSIVQSNQEIGTEKNKQTTTKQNLTRLAGVMSLYKKLLMINKMTNIIR